jgi:hypothetical protein
LPGTSLLISDEYALAWPEEPKTGMFNICVGIRVQGLFDVIGLCGAGLGLHETFTSLRSPAQQSAESSTKYSEKVLSNQTDEGGRQGQATETTRTLEGKQKAHNIG